MSIITRLRSAAIKRAAYNRTRNEIRTMPRDVAIDLGLFREDADRIAHEAVYG